MVNLGRNNLEWYNKCRCTPQVINNNGISSNAVYRYKNRGNRSQQYRRNSDNCSCWGEPCIGVHNSDHWSRYACVRRIQQKEGKKTLYQKLKEKKLL